MASLESGLLVGLTQWQIVYFFEGFIVDLENWKSVLFTLDLVMIEDEWFDAASGYSGGFFDTCRHYQPPPLPKK